MAVERARSKFQKFFLLLFCSQKRRLFLFLLLPIALDQNTPFIGRYPHAPVWWFFMSSLDPSDWSGLRVLGHQMMDDMIGHLAGIRAQPVWQPMSAVTRAVFNSPLPRAGASPEQVYETFIHSIKPYVTGNTHPRFFGWVHGGGNAISMLAELLAGAMNANCGGRDHAGIAVERQVIAWAAEMLGMPAGTGGVLLTGSSMANFVAVLCARFQVLGSAGRQTGIGSARLTAYAAAGVHRCVPAAMDMAGLGQQALRLIPLAPDGGMDVAALQRVVAADQASGNTPFLIVGTAGSVDTGGFDDLTALRGVADACGSWLHVDGAFGALAALSPRLRPLVAGIEAADSVAFDFHKWAQVTYDAGCVLVRDADAQLNTFAQSTDYLAAGTRGLAGGAPWPCDLGPDLSRGFRALKIWMTLSVYGASALGEVAETCCDLAQHLAGRVRGAAGLTLLAPVRLNIVCFAINGFEETRVQSLVADMQEAGDFAPSTTRIKGVLAIRVAIVNHRTEQADLDAFMDDVLQRVG
jgi:glutamate/tyrosine decarboxylase-like PLP-dependent enzyme